MTEDEFWALIDEARNKAGSTKAIPVWMEEHLLTRSASEISDFGAWLSMFVGRAYDERLWAAACIVGGGLSYDGFFGFSLWLLAQGKQVYEMAVNDPDSLADFEYRDLGTFGPLVELESLLYAYSGAYNKKIGKPKFYSPVGSPPGYKPPPGCDPSDGGHGLKNEGFYIERTSEEAKVVLKTNFPKLMQRFRSPI